MTVPSRFALNAFVSSLAFSALLFVAAGRFDYTEGWVYLLTSLLSALVNVVTIRGNPELMNERSKPGDGVKSWDKVLLGLSFLVSISTLILAGLDSGRYGWSPHWPWYVMALGVALLASGQAIFLVARKENKYFSTVVRIQKERGHTVCEAGIYKVVRHPGYLGMMVSTAGLPLILGSYWSTIPVFVSIILLGIRTSLEDRTLKDELDGYKLYVQKTPYRLIPRVW